MLRRWARRRRRRPPALTTVHIDAEDHGRQAARVILGLEPARRIAAPAEVIERDSV